MSVSSEEDNNLYQQLQHQLQRIALTAPITTQGTTCIPSFAGSMPQLAPPLKTKRKQVKNACVNCQKACKRCDDGRPCQRCIKYGLTETCKNSIRKERKKGIKRGPYKRRTQIKDQDDKYTTSTSSVSSEVFTVPASYGQIGELPVNPLPINLPSISSQIFGTQLSTLDSGEKFILIPQSSGGTSYYVLMPVQQQNQISILPTRICASKDLTTDLDQDIQVKIESEFQSGVSDGLLLEEDSKFAVNKEENYEIIPNKEKEKKDKSNLSVLSLVCSGLLNQETDTYEQANKEMDGNSSQDEDNESLKSNISDIPVSQNLVNNEKQQVSEYNKKNQILDSVKNKIVKENLEESLKAHNTPGDSVKNTTHVEPRVYSWDYHSPSFQTPSVESPLLFSTPANTYPVAQAQYVPIKCESNIYDMKCTRQQNEEFQLLQHGDSFSQNQIPMRQQYYEISPFTPSHTNPSNAYMVQQNQTSSFYQFRGQQLPPQFTPTSLSFAFSPRISNKSTPQSQIRCYAGLSVSSNGLEDSS
ncbi:hypothetical protein RhiirA5_484434 [Rhizophagus irregularis]|uniref:Zn(2)-C6 fungal-type domain-containing protein n=4 Tax=Rhizophagus irregularis TaxID=588596 RepID=A0A2I1EF33_9GLOM|nr:hypothetical protein RirG_109370 [Rhizophagus irregularis DAOM 197198w]PKC05869.1 hypothetical protein RhiirA5_484434 [Rhizophagus irregularis]GBC35211.1 Zn(2)-C6 fungal-specific transcription factor [Rhizophagus irregularis DAOM 181602=DAOM 197198]PKC62331.1 hypothetical protein RhiirA1_522299 [Rhizophagus irregularis]PKY20738.1 hypothetical protein RhiirB3_498616 [Rhizophagus irregularis]